jgi:hypothetical protein
MAKQMQMLKGKDDDMGMMAKWMQMLKGEDDDMRMMAKVDVNVEG